MKNLLQLSILVSLLLATGGCGGDPSAPDNEPEGIPGNGQDALTDGPVSETNGTDEEDTGELVQEPAATDDDDEYTRPVPEPAPEKAANDEAGDVSPDFAADFADVLRLEAETEFAKALALCRELRREYDTGGESKLLTAKIADLNQYARQAMDLRYAVQRLGPGNPPRAREFAQKEILEAGELGSLFLRKMVRNKQGEELAVALELITAQKDWLAVASILRRLREEPADDDVEILCDAGIALLDIVPMEKRSTLQADFTHLFRTLQNDAEFARRREAEVFMTLFKNWMQGDPQSFSEYLNIPEAGVYLEAYVKMAADAADNETNRWAHRQLFALGGQHPALVAWWAFDSVDDGRIRDRSGHQHTGVIEGAVDVNGKYGRALKFDGRDDLVRIPDAAELSGGEGAALTVSVVFKTDHADSFSPLVEKQWDGQQGDWGLNVSSGKIAYYSETTGNDYHALGGSVTSGEWHHAVFAIRQQEESFHLSMYLDGKQVFSKVENAAISADTRGNIYIGTRKYNNTESKGYAKAVIDDVRIYRRMLSPEEMQSIDLGTYLDRRIGQGSPEAAEALLEQIQASRNEDSGKARILRKALELTLPALPEKDRTGYEDLLDTPDTPSQ